MGYTAENVANKDVDTTLSSNSDTKYPSQKAVKTYSDTPLSSVWKVADGTDTTKRVSFDVSNISSSTTRIVTFPNTNVNLGNLPTSLTFSGSTLTLNTVNGSTQTATIPISLAYPQLKAIMLTSNANLIANNVYCISQSITGSKTYTLPSSPADGDTITIYDDNTSSGIAGTLSKTTATAINIASSGAIQLFSSGSGITTTNLLDGFFGPMPIPGFKLVFTYVSATNFWAVRTQFGNNDLFAVPDISFYLMNYTGWTTNPSPTSGWNNKYVAFSATNITSVRTLTFADRNINLDDMKYIPGINTNSSNSTAGSQSAIVAGSSNKTTKQNQCVLVGTLVNADSNCPEDTWIYGNRSTTYSSSKITGYGGIIKGQSLGTATASLVTGSNTKLPAYLTKPSTTHSISMFEFNLSCATDNGKIWCGRRFVCVRWDGSAATTDVQTNGTDYNPDTLTIIFSVSVSGGLLTTNVTNSSAGGSENSYWQVTYTAHHNGG